MNHTATCKLLKKVLGWALTLRLQAEDKRTIVFISHDLDEAVRIGDRIAIMQGGEVVQVGTPDDIINNPVNDYVRSFFRGG